MEPGLRECCRSIRIGKILIQKDEATKQRKLYYAKFPPDIHQRHVLLMDPVLATGGTLCEAIEVLLDYGVKEENILFLTLIAAPEGINKICSRYPRITIVSTALETSLDQEAYTVPGIGDFGERYFG
eukprot:Colp12_sorted_trinity150504_noHs@9617